MRFFIIQFIGAIAYLTLTLSYFRKKKKDILLMEIVSYLFFSLHYYLLSGITGTICNLIGLFALITIYVWDKYNFNYKRVIVSLFVISLFIINVINYQNFFSIFPIIASVIAILSFLFDNENVIRFVGVISAICWLVYAIAYKSYVSLFFEVAILIFTFIAFIKNRK